MVKFLIFFTCIIDLHSWAIKRCLREQKLKQTPTTPVEQLLFLKFAWPCDLINNAGWLFGSEI